jgi:hypothetical protein
MSRSKDIDFKEIHLSISDCVDNETFEEICNILGLDRNEETLMTLTITKIELKD